MDSIGYNMVLKLDYLFGIKDVTWVRDDLGAGSMQKYASVCLAKDIKRSRSRDVLMSFFYPHLLQKQG
jgi:hypothetical protein